MKLIIISMAMVFVAGNISVEAGATVASCLSKDTLGKLGFTAADSIEKVSSPTYCTDVYADPGRCIAADTIKAYIEKKQDEFTAWNAGYVKLTEMFDTFFGNIGETLSKIWASITNEKKEKTWKEQMADLVKKSKETHDKCFKTHNQIMHGLSCMLSSAKAGQLLKVETSELEVNVSKTSLQVVVDCMPVIAAICMYYKGGEDAKLDIPQTDTQKEVCVKHQEYEKCMSGDSGTETTCLDDSKKEEIFKKMYNPYSNEWMPSVTDVEKFSDKMLEWLKNAKNTVFSWFKSSDSTTARILESTMKVKFKISESGYDCYGSGTKSGVPVKGIRLYSLGIVASLIALIIRHN